jgi:hypothetical protein
MKVIKTITQQQPFFWLHLHDGIVDIIEANYTEATNISTGTVAGPYGSPAEAFGSIRDVITLP